MNFDLSEDQQLVRTTVERFANTFDPAQRKAWRGEPGGYPRTRWRELAALGLIALAAPEHTGGLGGSAVDLAVVAEALGQGLAIDPWLENAVLPALLAPSLPRLLDGVALAALAFAEPGRRYELSPALTRADTNGRISGRKTLVLGGAIADTLLVTAQAADGFALFAVPADADGIRRTCYAVVDGSIAAEVELNDATGERLACDEAQFHQAVGDARLLAAAEMVGTAQRLFDETLGYVKQREQFGVPIGTFQALQHRLVECYAGLEQARSMVWRTALDARRGEGVWPRLAAGAKGYVGGAAMRVAEEAVQMHGGMGQTDELAIGHGLKRIMLLDRLFGDRVQGLRDYARAA